MRKVIPIFVGLFFCLASLPWIWFIDTGFVSHFALCLFGPMSFLAVAAVQSWRTLRAPSAQARVALRPTLVVGGLWMMYVAVHYLLRGGEGYYLASLLASGLLLSTATYYFRRSPDRLGALFLILVPVDVLQCVAVFLQVAGFVPSLSPYFVAMGTFENPNVSAIVMALCLPVLIERLRTDRPRRLWSVAIALLAGASVVAIVLLKCRTAMLVVVCDILVYAARWARHKIPHRPSSVVRMAVLGLVILSGIAIGLYRLKPKSADGRLFIWQNTAELMLRHPVAGVGYGLFEKEYNLYQAQRLETLAADAPQRANARIVMTAYNELLEQGASGGVAGMALFALLVVMPCFGQRRKHAFSIAWGLSVLIVALTNLTVKAPAIWMLVMILFGYMASYECRHIVAGRRLGTLLLAVGGLLSCGLLYDGAGKVLAQSKLKESVEEFRAAPGHAVDTMAAYRRMAGSSEYYLRVYAQALLRTGQVLEARQMLEEAARWTANPVVYWNLAKCYRRLGDEAAADECLRYLRLQNVAIPQQ